MDQGEIYEEGTPEQIYTMQFADGGQTIFW